MTTKRKPRTRTTSNEISWPTVVKPAPARRQWRCSRACRAHVTAFPAGVLAVARSVLHQGDSSISAPLAELGLQPVSAVVASSVNAQTGVCCGFFLQAVASSGLKPLATFAEVSARLAASHDATARRHGFVALLRILDADTNASSEACWRVCEAIVSSDIDEPPLRPGREPVLALACRCLSRMAAGTDRLQPLVSCVQRAESLRSRSPVHVRRRVSRAGLRRINRKAPPPRRRVGRDARFKCSWQGVLKCARAYPDEADEDVVDPARAADAACAVLAALVAPNWKDDAPKKRDAQCNSASKVSVDERVLDAAFQPALQSLQASCFRSISAPASLRILELVVCSCAHPSLASAVVGVLQDVCSRVRAPSLRCALSNAFKCCLRLPGEAVDRCLFLLCQVQLTKPTSSDESEDDAAALKACARLFSTDLRRECLGIVLRAQRDGVLPSARVVDVARLVRTRYPPSELAADVRAALGLVVAEKGPDVAGDLARAVRDEKKFRKAAMVMGGEAEGVIRCGS